MALISAGAPSGLVIELKPDLPRHTGAGKLELLSDLASFANASGGHIIYGANPGNGAGAELAGLEHESVEVMMAWLEQAAFAGIAPHIHDIQFKAVALRNQRRALVVRIPKTWTGPHMVVFQEANKFYSRNARGKYAPEVAELRAAFSVGESLRERMQSFRLERANAILNRALSVPLSEAPRMVLHILPLCSFRAGFRIGLERVTACDAQMLRPMAARSVVSQFNYDGLITSSSTEKSAYSHVQVFRNGCLEAADTSLLEPKDGRKFFPSAAFEREVIQCGERLLGLMRSLEVSPPYVVMLSFLGVRGYNMFVGSIRWQPSAHPVERDHLYLDEVIIDDSTPSFSRAIRPAFDQAWNSCGWPQSLNYDAEGNWREHGG